MNDALNIIPDENPDDEIDDTKELQIEEALKLYQVALKLHSQGPEHYSEAASAYTNLFNSDIFQYPESVTEFLRLDKHPEVEFTEASHTLGLDIAAAVAEASPSTLPQILYLSYKNHGQFILDCVKGSLRLEPLPPGALNYQAKAAIDNFALALASDESDTELWRRTARIGSMLGSRRIARYCLEAAVEVDDDPTVAEVDPMSLEEGFAGEQLKQELEILLDTTSLSHPVMAPYLKKKMPKFISKSMDPYPFLPDATTSLQIDRVQVDAAEAVHAPLSINLDYRSWLAVGERLCEMSRDPTASRILLNFPPPGTPAQAESFSQPDAALGDDTLSAEDQIMKDVGTTDSPAAESNEAVEPTPVASKLDESAIETIATATVPISDDRRPSNVLLPTRKRSQSAAGIRDTPEEENGAQKRSKRIRNRDNTEGAAIDSAALFAEQLKPFVSADENVFAFVSSLLEKLGVDDLGTLNELQAGLQSETTSDHTDILVNTAARDLRDILRTWDDPKASTFVNGKAEDVLGSSAGSANAGLAAFLDQSKIGPQRINNIPLFADSDGLSEFANKVNNAWMPFEDVVWEWLCAILPTYMDTLWTEQMKVMVVRIITYNDAEIFIRLGRELKSSTHNPLLLSQWQDMAQILFELHIDIYSRITNPTSAVPFETRLLTKERLGRWADFTADVIRTSKRDQDEVLLSRYLWASVFYATMAESVSREHKVLCWSDLQALLQKSGQPAIELQNNAVMPEISIEAAEREVSRLTTMEFFFNLFQTDCSDPSAIIETLEPVLDPESACESMEVDNEESVLATETADGTPPALRDMWKFLKSGSTSLRLFLWQRLCDAYYSIGYITKVFSCHLKSIEIIVADLRTGDYVDTAEEPRRHKLLLWLKALDDLLVKALTIALNDASTCFEIIDERHIKSTCAALAQLARVLHTAAIFDDEIRVGMTQLPQNAAYAPHGSFNEFNIKLREMQVRTWALQYTMIKEAANQNIEKFPSPAKDLADYLALVHFSLGLRKCCKASNKIFLKMMKVEMIRLKDVENWEDYIGQVLYDLYGVRLGVGTYLLDEHGCPAEKLDRRTVLNIADQIIVIANRMPIKDLLKHELRGTLERMQTAVGPTKSSPQMQHNLRNYTEYLKTSIRPSDLYRAWRGQVQVDSLPVVTPESHLADQNWFLLLGMINLTKFRATKRIGPGSQTDDLRVAATFLRLQLQFSGDFWETWYRLAQCFDHELEEEVLWSADRVNNHRPDLVRLQRSSIHCYIMALSTAHRFAADDFETAEKLSEMCFDFGMRIYSASREPFGMEAFYVDEFEKHMSGSEGMYKKALHDELSPYRAWNFALNLFKESLKDRPSNWMAHYMAGKCLWKAYCKADQEWDSRIKATRPPMEAVLNSLTNAIKLAPKLNNSSRSEPLLEPHYKLVSVTHKLVSMASMTPQEGADLLQKQPLAPDKGAPVVINSAEEWQTYILKNFRHLRAIDKQHWNHRILARVATILFDDADPKFENANAARNELKDSIFTKTMHIQVWKSDHERAGRHCVYMERYVKFMVKLLVITNDKSSLEMLVKRVKKKNNEFHRADKVWADCCLAYIRLIRRQAGIEASADDNFKSETHENFENLSNRLDQWLEDPRVTQPIKDAFKEINDLKKLNGTAMKATPIDDLISDIWATLHLQVAKMLPNPDQPSMGNAQMDGGADSPSPLQSMRNMGPMSLNNLVMDMNGTQVPVPVTFAGSEPARARKIGISRREVLKRAEQAYARMPDIPRPAPPAARPRLVEPSPNLILGSNDGSGPSKPRRGTSTPRVQTPAQQAREVDLEQDDEEEGDHPNQQLESELAVQKTLEAENGGDEEGEGDGDTESVRGSVHDSADDESDLSDPPDMDDFDPSSMFPDMQFGVQSGDEDEAEAEEHEADTQRAEDEGGDDVDMDGDKGAQEKEVLDEEGEGEALGDQDSEDSEDSNDQDEKEEIVFVEGRSESPESWNRRMQRNRAIEHAMNRYRHHIDHEYSDSLPEGEEFVPSEEDIARAAESLRGENPWRKF
ncbi:related to transcriptional corepressor HIR3 [Rhynchosporium graminicola]|uniref:Histone transcription regulator 3 homolog n=1 Tax=Rhynchosporium graminicola TaxID=2792576 RepID=A0A1E1JZA1_9HELO|nr:related to transcriptional corepressor HIR3 [Rhynchosporium commune]